MSAYLAIISAAARSLLQYRAAAVAGVVTQLFFGFVMVQVFTAFYASAEGPQPMSLAQVVGYVWLGQALLGMAPWNVDPDVRDQIRSGNVVYEMLRPIDLYGLWFTRSLARRGVPTLLRAVPLVAIAGAFLGLPPPASVEAGLAFAAALVGALLLAAAITTLMTVTLMWTLSGDGIMMLAVALVIFFSGQAVPLPLFPAWAQAWLEALPFRGLVDIPYRLYLGHLPAVAAPGLVGFQLAWAAAFVVAGRLLLTRGRRVLVAQGG